MTIIVNKIRYQAVVFKNTVLGENYDGRKAYWNLGIKIRQKVKTITIYIGYYCVLLSKYDLNAKRRRAKYKFN